MTFTESLKSLNQFSPKTCRLLARRKGGKKPMTTREIAAKSGLARSTIGKMSKMKNWDKVTFSTAGKFGDACGVNPLSPAAQIRFLRESKLTYIKTAPRPQKKMYARLMA